MNVAVLFGGKVPEHEVSIITGIQVLHALEGAGYGTLPIYVSKKGEWVVGDRSFYDPKTFSDQEKAIYKKKRVVVIPYPEEENKLVERSPLFSLVKTVRNYEVDVFFPCFHGRNGEDGSVQGLFELAGVPYVGCDVQASAIGMDKVVSKHIAARVGVPVLADNWGDREKSLKQMIQDLKFPVFVKPVRLGSSIGIRWVNNTKELRGAVEVAFCYDTKVMVEQGLENAREINISLLGNDPYECSACEEPLGSGEILSFEDKYISKEGGPSKGMATAKRIVPAKIKKVTEKKIQGYARRFFREIGGSGLCRIDFLMSRDEREIYFNEINTLPGSIAFYLWKEKGISFGKLVDMLVKLAIERRRKKEELVTTFKSNILEGFEGGKMGKLKL